MGHPFSDNALNLLKAAEAREAAKQDRLSRGLPATRSYLERFTDNPTRKTAIDLQCHNCMGGEDNPGVRAMIRECTATPGSSSPCALYSFRPFKQQEDD